MNAVDLLRRLHQHRMWANHNLLAAAAKLPPDALRQSFAIGQGSIWKSLLHLYAAEYVWLGALLGDEAPITPGDVPTKIPGNQEGPDAIPTLERLAADWSVLDARWQKYLSELQVEALDQMVVKLVTAGKMAGQRMKTRCSDVLLHVCTHAGYTTAQVVNMLRHAGAESLPEVMLIALARQEMAQSS